MHSDFKMLLCHLPQIATKLINSGDAIKYLKLQILILVALISIDRIQTHSKHNNLTAAIKSYSLLE
jgi:hypothetical protein